MPMGARAVRESLQPEYVRACERSTRLGLPANASESMHGQGYVLAGNGAQPGKVAGEGGGGRRGERVIRGDRGSEIRI